MTHFRNIFTGSIALLFISASGCAGSGLKNMFSRNETAGYKTLEELEAEEAERDAAVADADEPRFAPWLPFGKKSRAETDAVATADAAASDDAATSDSKEESTSLAWWKKPFQSRDDAELDPFLTDDSSQKAVVAKNGTSTERSTLPGTAESEAEFSSKNTTARTVSDRRETKSLPAEDQLLAEKFEKHFQQDTVDAAAENEGVEPLIVAGKSTKKDNQVPESDSGEKLHELERLLADNRSSARKSPAKTTSFGEKSPDPTQASDDLFGRFEDRKSTTQQQAGMTRNRASNAVESFDSLLAGTPASIVSSQHHKSLTSGRQNRFVPAEVQPATDVEVANADWLFSSSGKNSSTQDASTGSPGSASGGWFGKFPAEGAQGTQPGSNASAGGSERNGRMLKPAADQFAMKSTTGLDNERIPSPVVPDTPDTRLSFPASRLAQAGGKTAIPDANVMHRISASRELPTTETSSGLTDDSFFTTASSASTSSDPVFPVAESAAPAEYRDAAAGRGFMASIKGRHWLLLFGGVIVVLLLFAPGRKKPLQANHA